MTTFLPTRELLNDPLSQVGLAGAVVVIFLVAVFVVSYSDYNLPLTFKDSIGNYGRFIYSCFLKPHTGDGNGSQQDALESFYKAQASVYDATRRRLLHGREDMLGLVAAQCKFRTDTGALTRKPIWVDVSLEEFVRRVMHNANYM